MLKIYEKDKEDKRFLKLIQKSDSEISLCIVDESGNRVNNGTILVLDSNLGSLKLCRDVNEKELELLGLDLAGEYIDYFEE